MPTLLNPAADIDDLVGFFEISADDGGVMVDAELCQTFAQGLADIGETLEALVAFARSHGCVETLDDRARTPEERRAMARAIAAATAGERIVRLPIGASGARLLDGGTAA